MDDNEKDLFIKSEFQKDSLMSKKVDNLFNDFLEGKINMEDKIEKVSTINKKKNYKTSKFKKILSMAASIMIIFLAANVYAATRGYNNIFFAIRNLIIQKDTFVSGKSNILVDKDITISYEPITIDEGISISINRFIVKEKKARLFVTISEKENSEGISKLIVTDKNGKEIGEYLIKNQNREEYSEEIEISLKKYNDNIDILKLYAIRDNKAFTELQINLSEQTIDIISNGITDEMKKISEVELKKVLSEYVMINYYNDVISKNTNSPKVGLKKYIDMEMVDMSRIYINNANNSNNTSSYSLTDINMCLKELCGRMDNTPLVTESDTLKYNENKKEYEIIPTDRMHYAMCINISNIEYKNGVYYVTFTYCYLVDNGDVTQNQITKLDIFETTFKLKINENYKYIKYQIQDVYNINSRVTAGTNEYYDTNNTNQNDSGSSNNQTNNNSANNNNSNNSNNNSNNKASNTHNHEWTVIKRTGNEDFHTTLDGTHSVICNICGEIKSEPHNFGSWYTLYDGTAWSLWCTDCGRYIYTEDYNFVQNSGYQYEEKGKNYPAYSGVWYNSSTQNEFTIHSINDNMITFSWFLYRLTGIDNTAIYFSNGKAIFYFEGYDDKNFDSKNTEDEKYIRKATISLEEDGVNITVEDVKSVDNNYTVLDDPSLVWITPGYYTHPLKK